MPRFHAAEPIQAPHPGLAIPQVRKSFKNRSVSQPVAGCGGGYDVFGAVPLLIELIAAGHTVHLANLTFCSVDQLPDAIQHPIHKNLFSVGRQCATPDMYCPEAWLARWMWEHRDEDHPVWCFRKTGVRPLAAAYQTLVDELGVDSIILIDGGVDALLRGDEVSLGTPAEDLITIAAVDQINVGEKLLVCTAMGAEMRDGISHAQVFERISALTRTGAFLGSSSLLATSDSGAQYLDAVDFTFDNQKDQRLSHVHRVVCSAMRGEFGAVAPHVWLSPLLPIYWYFSLHAVVESHLFLKHLLQTEEIWEVTLLVDGLRKGLEIRFRDSIPI
jgi:hypothetical protein